MHLLKYASYFALNNKYLLMSERCQNKSGKIPLVNISQILNIFKQKIP